MALAYSFISEIEDLMRGILPDGEYPFSVKSCTQKPTKSQLNNMLEVELEVINSDGQVSKIKDWIILDMPEMAWKLRHFAATCGLIQDYEDQTLVANDFINKHGVAKIKTREYEKNGELRKANSVHDYVKPPKNKVAANSDDFVNDDIKF